VLSVATAMDAKGMCNCVRLAAVSLSIGLQ
jgi:hypothetical protein